MAAGVIVTAITLFSINANAINITVMVGQNSSGGAANAFNPATFTASVGDNIVFTLFSGTHNVTSVSLPVGAGPISSGTMTSTPYIYNVGQAGTYGYVCTFHSSTMAGGFSATTVGIANPTVDLLTSVYPNPFVEKFTLKYNGIESVDFYNILGDKVRTIELSSVENKIEIDLTDLAAGVYFLRSKNDGIIVETKKIVKSK